MVLGSQGSSDRSLEGFRRSPGVIWSAPGALWGMFGTPLWFKSWSKTLQILRNAVSLEILSAPGALWGMFWTSLGNKRWSKTLRSLQDAVRFGLI